MQSRLVSLCSVLQGCRNANNLGGDKIMFMEKSAYTLIRGVCKEETRWAYLGSYFCLKWVFWAARLVIQIKHPIMNYGQLFSSVFSKFHGQKFIFKDLFLHYTVCAWFFFYLGSTSFGLNFFRASFFGYYIKECLSATPSFSLLALMEFGWPYWQWKLVGTSTHFPILSDGPGTGA